MNGICLVSVGWLHSQYIHKTLQLGFTKDSFGAKLFAWPEKTENMPLATAITNHEPQPHGGWTGVQLYNCKWILCLENQRENYCIYYVKMLWKAFIEHCVKWRCLSDIVDNVVAIETSHSALTNHPRNKCTGNEKNYSAPIALMPLTTISVTDAVNTWYGWHPWMSFPLPYPPCVYVCVCVMTICVV